METLRDFLGNAIYAAQAAMALWGVFCVIVVWRRVGQSRFRSEDAQNEFLEEVQRSLLAGDWATAQELCEDDSRALPQLCWMAIENRKMPFDKVRHLLGDRFQRDVLADLDYRISWVNTVIKTGPMLGLFGTVGGMMGAFDTLGAGEKVDPAQLAGDISVALLTTVIGLAIAIPLMVIVAAINVRIKKMEDLVGAGLGQFLEVFKEAQQRSSRSA
jgi:biopolymer transport protein ExbB/TolQ